MAPRGVQTLLDSEESETWARSTARRSGSARTDPRHVSSQSAVGSAPPARRTHELWHFFESRVLLLWNQIVVGACFDTLRNVHFPWVFGPSEHAHSGHTFLNGTFSPKTVFDKCVSKTHRAAHERASALEGGRLADLQKRSGAAASSPGLIHPEVPGSNPGSGLGRCRAEGLRKGTSRALTRLCLPTNERLKERRKLCPF